MPQRERMSPVDMAWLRMDAPGNLMMIVGIYMLAGPLDLPRLRRVVQTRLLRHLRFRARVVRDTLGTWWEEDEDFDIDQHLVLIALPGKADQRELERLTGQLAGEALDPNRPLWQIHVVENAEGGAALIVRIHHAIGDGISLVGALLRMTSTDPHAPDAEAPAPRPQRAADSHGWDARLRPITRATVRAIDRTGGVAARVLKAYAALIDDPDLAGEAAGETARVAAQVARDVAGIALMDPDTPTSLKGQPAGSKRVAWADPVPLSEVKAVGHALGCSLNDVLLACVAGAIRSYLITRGEDIEGGELRAMVPVNLRAAGDERLGNRFGLVPVLLPIGIANPIERVFEVRRRMAELKHGYTAVLSMGLLAVAGLVPRALQQQITSALAAKATAVMTNVPGPREPLYMAGSRIERLLFWVPQSGSIGMGVSILSYDGGVQFGLVTDKKICSEPHKIIERFRPEFEQILNALMLLPWDEPVDADAAEAWLFPELAADAAPVAQTPRRAPRKRARAARPATPAQATDAATAAETAGADAAAPPRPAGLKRRRSAFAAARAAAD